MYKKIFLYLKKHRGIVIILFLGLILRLIYFNVILHNFGSSGFYMTSNGDAVEYLILARQWLQYGTFQNLNGLPGPEIFRMPGYPLFIAFFYKIVSDVALAILVQNIIFIFSIALFYKFTLSLFKNKTIALISSGFLAFEPSMIYWNNQLITETLFMVLIFLSFYCSFVFIKGKNLYFPALSGLFLALAIFVRPAGEYLAIIFILFYVLLLLFKKMEFKKIFFSILIFIIAFLLPLAPWIARNKYYFDSYAVSNSSAIGFGKYYTAISIQAGEKIITPKFKNEMEKAKLARKRAMIAISAHPIHFVKIYSLSLIPFLFGDGYLSVFGRIFPDLEKARIITDWKGGGGELFGFLGGHKGSEAFIFFGGKIIWTLITLFGFIGIFYSFATYRKQYPILILFLLFIGYFSLASGIGSYSRFRFPVVPFIFLFTSLGIYWLVNRKAHLKSG